jgi:hypothetical protein
MHAKETMRKSFVSEGISGMNMRIEAINKRTIPAYVDGIDINLKLRLKASVSHLSVLPGGLCVLIGLSYFSLCFL